MNDKYWVVSIALSKKMQDEHNAREVRYYHFNNRQDAVDFYEIARRIYPRFKHDFHENEFSDIKKVLLDIWDLWDLNKFR